MSSIRFEIEIDQNETRHDRRCRILAYPVVSGGAQAYVFDVNEIDEILSHLTDSSQQAQHEAQHYESLRLRKVFASKACRMSIMIGKDLTRKQMNTVVQHLASLAKPWVERIRSHA
jgi:DNA mismatch repair protein PMS2